MTGMVEKIGRAIDAAAEKYIKDWHVKCGKDKTLIPYIGMADVPPDVLGLAALEAARETLIEELSSKHSMAPGTGTAETMPSAVIDAALKENDE